MNETPEIPKWMLSNLNQIFNLKLKAKKNYEKIERDLIKLEEGFADGQLEIYDPIGEKCPDTRTDVEVNITGDGGENLVIIEVIKPIIRMKRNNAGLEHSVVVQKGIVVVESKG